MILGFLGKGGSGKSTLATATVEYLAYINHTVLALDADYNMDLTYNLSVPDTITHLGTKAKEDMKRYLGADAKIPYGTIVQNKKENQFFTLSPVDAFTEKYTEQIRPNVYAMSIGPQPHQVLDGQMCSHGLGGLLKVYLPFLKLSDTEHVIVDEKAGADGVSTGIPTGFDFAVVVAEATPHGVKAAKQIAELLEYYDTPYGFVVNKIRVTTDMDHVRRELGKNIMTEIPFGENVPANCIQDMHLYAEHKYKSQGDTRLARSVKKFERNNRV